MVGIVRVFPLTFIDVIPNLKYEYGGQIMRIFEIGVKSYTFSSSKFSELFKNYRKKNGMKVDNLEQTLADKLYVQQSTIHSWKFGPSGPTDLETIINLAKCLELENYTYLLKEELTMPKLSNLQMQSAKKIYDVLVGLLHEFDLTGGFTTSMWYDLEAKGSKDPESDMYDYIQGLEEKILLVFRQEYFYLHDTPIYNELLNFMDEDLGETYNGKLGYAYRFEAVPEGNPTKEDDYVKAMDKLNSIIEKYI